MGGYKGLKKCSTCDYTHRLTAQVRRHERQAHGANAVPCTVAGCQMRLPYNRLARHIREKHSTTSTSSNATSGLVADPEGEEASSTGSSSASSSRTGDDRPKQFDDLPLLDSAAKLFKCAQCGKTCQDRNAYRKHMNRVHLRSYRAERNREKCHCCDWPNCGKAFASAAKLEDHRNGHTGERPYNCEHCNRDFTAKAEFGRHLRKYHGLGIHVLNQQIEQYIEAEEECELLRSPEIVAEPLMNSMEEEE